MGERRLKDIDEPERVYELVIDGLEQPGAKPPAADAASASASVDESDFDDRIAKLGERLSADIEDSVLRHLERTLGAPQKPTE
jgi:hypothetical protein